MSKSPAPNFVYLRRKKQAKFANHLMPSIAVNREPAGSLVKEPGGKNIVYKRKLQGQSATVVSSEIPRLSVVSSDSVKELLVISSDSPSNAVSESESESESIKGCFLAESDEASKSSRQKIIEVDNVNGRCSLSKSNTELVSVSTESEDSVEYSSSSVPEKDLCISMDRISPKTDGSGSDIFRFCKICSTQENALKMLICDSCEEAFHLFCCNPRIRRIPVDEWFCHSCSKKRHKILNGTLSASPCLAGEKGSCFVEEPSPIALMLQDNEPYTSSVRCGKGFQAEVPVWSGPITTDVDAIPEPLEMDPSNFVTSTELNLNKKSELSSIGNWLQCRDVVESGDGTICGKWRRAPLFEVQTDKWDCFSSVHWDATRADCAAPQELDTDEVLKQLKYIQMLRPRLDAKRRKNHYNYREARERRKSKHMKNHYNYTKALKQDDDLDAKRRKLKHGKNDSNSTQALKQNNVEERKKDKNSSEEQQNQREIIMYRRYTHGPRKVGTKI